MEINKMNNEHYLKIGNGDSKALIELTCPWCEHVDKYSCAKYDQPTCKKCSRLVPKRKFIK